MILGGCPADTLGVYNREKMVIKICVLWHFMLSNAIRARSSQISAPQLPLGGHLVPEQLTPQVLEHAQQQQQNAHVQHYFLDEDLPMNIVKLPS